MSLGPRLGLAQTAPEVRRQLAVPLTVPFCSVPGLSRSSVPSTLPWSRVVQIHSFACLGSRLYWPVSGFQVPALISASIGSHFSRALCCSSLAVCSSAYPFGESGYLFFHACVYLLTSQHFGCCFVP